jgi:carbon monoxide dehydrogenase subunit G
MPTVRVAKNIQAKPEDVWPFLEKADRWPEWMPGLESSSVTNGKNGLGRSQHLELSFGGYRGDIDLEITQWEPPRRIGWKHLSERIQGLDKQFAKDIRTVVMLTPSGGGTELSFEGSWEPVGLMSKMLGKTMIEGRANSIFETAAANLERLAGKRR